MDEPIVPSDEKLDEDRLERTQNILRLCLRIEALMSSISSGFAFPTVDGNERTALSISRLSVSSHKAQEIRIEGIKFVSYAPKYLSYIMDIMSRSLSEVYDISIYENFVIPFPDFTYIAVDLVTGQPIGAIVGRKDVETNSTYIAMLAVEENYRKRGIGKALIRKLVEISKVYDCDYVSLETEVINEAALRLYGSLGFIRETLLPTYYVNGNDAFELRLYLSTRSYDKFREEPEDTTDWGEIIKRNKKLYQPNI